MEIGIRSDFWGPKQRWLAAAILGLAALLRFYGLASQPFWSDEYLSWQYAKSPDLFRCALACSFNDSPPLFYMLLHYVVKISDSVFFLRLVPALSGVACAWAVMRIGRHWFSPRLALSAGLLAALCPMGLYYSQEAKMYSLLAFINLMLMDESARCLEDGNRKPYGIGLWALLGIYTWYLAGLYWLGLAGAALLFFRFLKTSVLWKGLALAAIGFLPWLPLFMKSIITHQGSAANTYMGRAFVYTLENYSVGFWEGDLGRLAGLAAFGGAALFAWPRLRPHSRGAGEGKGPAAGWFPSFLAVFCFLPLLVSWAVSLTVKPIYADRHMLAGAFGLILLACLGLEQLPKLWKTAWFLALLGLELYSVGLYQFNPAYQRVDYSKPYHDVVANWREGDAIFHSSIVSLLPFHYFSIREGEKGGYLDLQPKQAYFPLSERRPDLRPNWRYCPPPDYVDTKPALGIRAFWRRLNLWLTKKGLGAYAGYDRSDVYGWRLDHEALPGVRRIWYIRTDTQGERKAWLPQTNVWKGLQSRPAPPFDPARIGWLQQKGFHLAEERTIGNVGIYLFVSAVGNRA